MKLLEWITSLFDQRLYQTGVERYVASKHPTNVAEVEYWIRRYDQRKEWTL
jgi:hypothetical protein